MGLMVFHKPGKVPVPSLLLKTIRLEPGKSLRLQPLPAICRQLAVLLKLALLCDPT